MRSQSQDGGQLPVSQTASASSMQSRGQGLPGSAHTGMQQHTAQVNLVCNFIRVTCKDQPLEAETRAEAASGI